MIVITSGSASAMLGAGEEVDHVVRIYYQYDVYDRMASS